ncbi:MAG: hypothetical protein IPP14_15675 [Planctomycetes bacterium]|nr:hypothetical protein [Planctomycetota bacterium]
MGSNTLAYLSEVGTGGDVTAASNITDNAVVRGDGGAKGVQNSGVVIDDPSSSTIRIHTGAAAHILLTPDTSLSSGTFDTTVDAGGTGSTTLNLGTVAANATNVGRSGKTTTVNGLASLAGQARLAINTPSQITSNQTGYTGFNTGIVQRASTDASRTINTILAPATAAGGYLRVINIGSFDLVLLNDDGATGTAADRIITGLGTNYTLGPAQACELIYDTTSSRWRVL